MQGAEQAGAGEQERGSIRLHYENAPLNYANIALVSSTPEEVILNFGVNAVPPTAEREVNVNINSRVILSYPSAKRLAITLGNMVKRYEDAHGVIDLPRRPVAGADAASQAGQDA
jgi:hypothetical protein